MASFTLEPVNRAVWPPFIVYLRLYSLAIKCSSNVGLVSCISHTTNPASALARLRIESEPANLNRGFVL
jgi:hypothetical protein